MLLKEIPSIEFPNTDVAINPIDEEVIDLQKEAPDLFLYDFRYFKEGIIFNNKRETDCAPLSKDRILPLM